MKIKSRKPDLYNRVSPAFDFLEQNFMTEHENFPVRFGHGDYHPLNVNGLQTASKLSSIWNS